MESVTLEHLPDETIIHIIGHLTLWDAFALETTNKRMHGLVRAHQKVQKWLDITFPSQLSRSQLKAHQGMKKTILTRFGPKLLNIKGLDGLSFLGKLDDEEFIEELAIACPNLIELPSHYIPDLSTYASDRLVALKKIVLKREDFTAAEVKDILMNSPQLEDLAIYTDHVYSDRQLTNDGSFLKAVAAGVVAGNVIRKLDLYFEVDIEPSLYQVVELIKKLPLLEHFHLEPHFHGGDDIEEQLRPIVKLFAMTNFSKSIKPPSYVLTALPVTISRYVTSMTIRRFDSSDTISALKKCTNLKRLRIELSSVPNYFGPFVLVIPQTVSELSVCDIAEPAEVDLIDGLITNQGKQLESITLDYRKSRQTKPALEELMWTRQLFVSITKSTAALKSLSMSKLVLGFDSQYLRDFFKTCGKSLEHFHVDKQVLSLRTLQLISAECKALKSLKCGFALDIKEDKTQINQLKNLLKGMANLYEAEFTIMKYIGKPKFDWTIVANTAYANYKFMFCRWRPSRLRGWKENSNEIFW